MEYQNYLNLSPEERDRNIYRVMSTARLMDMIKDRRNVLSKPCSWNDPFENFILQGKGKLSNGRVVIYGMRDSFYGQCWTFCRESDAMWRIYSHDHDNDGVKIKTTIRRLFSSLYSAVPQPRRDTSCFIGKVRYLSRQAIQSYLAKPVSLESSGAGLAETLIIKRIAFSHEKEVRLVYWASERNSTSDFFHYEINPYELIDEIVFDSRLNLELYNRHKEELRSMGYRGRIIQSALYSAPENIFTKII